MIWAQGHDRAIGRDGTMAWHVPEDMAFFRRNTMGCPVIMGRKTWDGLGKYQPLSGRENIVVTRTAGFEAEDAHVVASIEEACELGHRLADANIGGTSLVWVMGGAQIYQAALGLAEILAVTEIDVEVEGADAFAPAISQSHWQLQEADPAPDRWHTDTTSGLPYRFTVYTRQGLEIPERFTLLNGSNGRARSEQL